MLTREYIFQRCTYSQFKLFCGRNFGVIVMEKSWKKEERKLIDKDGFRLNVGIVIFNDDKQLLLAKRVGMKQAWQFPQGGMVVDETPTEALYRELYEELGLEAHQVQVIAETKEWLSYLLPKQFIRRDSKPLCIGQKQKWFLLHLLSEDSEIHLDRAPNPEFDEWRWVDFWYPIDHVIAFKKEVYEKVLTEFEPYIKAEVH